MGDSSCSLDDLAPAMTTISYAFSAVMRTPHGHRCMVKAEHRIRFIPEYEDAPPNEIQVQVTMRKGILSRDVGRLDVYADVRSINRNGGTLNLHLFSSSKNTPSLTGLTAKLMAHTTWSAGAKPHPPSVQAARLDPEVCSYSSSRTLSTHGLDIPFVDGYAAVAVVVLPVHHFALIPSFSSCLTARFYELVVELGYVGGHVKLRFPTDVTNSNAPRTPLGSASAIPFSASVADRPPDLERDKSPVGIEDLTLCAPAC